MQREEKWKSFAVRVGVLAKDAAGCTYLCAWLPGDRAGFIDHAGLPKQVRSALRKPGLYRVCRVEHGGISVRLSPYPAGEKHTAYYTDVDSFLCKELCEKVGYDCKEPETIQVTIQKLKGGTS